MNVAVERALASFRFYEELNDFLPRHRRKRPIEYAALTEACPPRTIQHHCQHAQASPAQGSRKLRSTRRSDSVLQSFRVRYARDS
jgi:hypothetical protein